MSDKTPSLCDFRYPGLASHRHRPQVDSTNDLAAQFAADAIPSQLPWLVTCDRQLAGRGRQGRRWRQAPGGLAFSVACQPPGERDPSAAGWLAIWTGLCLQATAAHFLPEFDCRLKWPNDLMIDGRKNAGILIEAVPAQPGRYVVGIGINVNSTPAELEEPASESRLNTAEGAGWPQRPASSQESESLDGGPDRFSWRESGRCFELGDVLSEFLRRWLTMEYHTPGQREHLQGRWQVVDWLENRRIQVQAHSGWTREGATVMAGQLSSAMFTGLYRGIDSRGFLQLECDDGRHLVFPSCQQLRRL